MPYRCNDSTEMHAFTAVIEHTRTHTHDTRIKWNELLGANMSEWVVSDSRG